MNAVALSIGQLLWGLVLVTVLAFAGGFLLAAGRDVRGWNGRRLHRARRYRAAHGTPWWIVETPEARARRRWLELQVARTEGTPRLKGGWR